MSPVVETLKERRKQLKLSQQALAELTNMSQATIGNIEAGIKSPKLQTIEKIANALDCRVTVLPCQK